VLPEKQRIVVTGIGVLTSIGIGIDAYWDSLVKGKSGIGSVTQFDASDYPCRVASEVNDFDPAQYMDPKEVKRNDRYTHFAVAAAKLAMTDGKLDKTSVDPERFGVLVSSGIGGLGTIEKQSRTLFERGPRRVSPFMIPCLIANIASGVVAIEMGARGPNFSVVSACAGGTHAIGEALKFLRSGDVDVMLAGGSEAAITQLGFAGFCAMKAMSTSYNDNPDTSSRPFDATRDGFVMGEGAATIILEEYEHAKKRGAKIYAEIIGAGLSGDAYHVTAPAPEGEGAFRSMREALRDGGINPEDVDYINAHGTSTILNDLNETKAIKKLFGEHAYKLAISSTKSMTGHLLGATGALEAIVCILVIKNSIIPPTINLDVPDPECDLNYTPKIAISKNVDYAITNTFGFGGHNSTLLFKKYDE